MSRADILGCEFLTKQVALPNGKMTTVRELSAGERYKFFELTKGTKDMAEIQAWLIVFGTVGDDGAATFSDSDVPVLMKRPPRVLQPLSEEILKLSGLAEDETKNA